MENRRNYYRILQVQPGAPVEIIRASYRTLMQRLRAHPDLGGDHWNAALINEAYAVLTDARRRTEYDREFQAGVLDQRHDATGTHRRLRAVLPAGQCLFCGMAHRLPSNAGPRASCRRCASPLQRLATAVLSGDDRRAVGRLPRHYPLDLYTHWPQPQPIAAWSHDVSPAGISFVTGELLEPHAVVRLDSALCRAVVQVTNLRLVSGADGWLVGSRFLSVAFTRSRGTFLSTQA